MKKHHHIIWEFVMIIGSILMFRTAWELSDRYVALFSSNATVFGLFALGAALTAVAVYVLAHDRDVQV